MLENTSQKDNKFHNKNINESTAIGYSKFMWTIDMQYVTLICFHFNTNSKSKYHWKSLKAKSLIIDESAISNSR